MKYPNTNKKYNRRTSPLWRRPLFWIGTIVLVVGLSVVALAATGRGPFGSKQQASLSAPPSHTSNTDTKGEPKATNTTPPASQDSSIPSDNKIQPGTTTQTTGEKPKVPEGNFVPTHHLSLGSQGNSDLVSSCSTTPAASCQIVFTKDGVTKQLPVKKTDAGGGAYWTWTLNQIGLTAGTWHVQAQAIIASQMTTADDPLSLEIAQ